MEHIEHFRWSRMVNERSFPPHSVSHAGTVFCDMNFADDVRSIPTSMPHSMEAQGNDTVLSRFRG